MKIRLFQTGDLAPLLQIQTWFPQKQTIGNKCELYKCYVKMKVKQILTSSIYNSEIGSETSYCHKHLTIKEIWKYLINVFATVFLNSNYYLVALYFDTEWILNAIHEMYRNHGSSQSGGVYHISPFYQIVHKNMQKSFPTKAKATLPLLASASYDFYQVFTVPSGYQ